MSENIEFVKKVKPVWVDTTGKEIRAPFINLPFTEATALTVAANVAASVNTDVNLHLIIPATEDCFISNITFHIIDALDFMRDMRDGLLLELFYTVAGTNYYPVSHTYSPFQDSAITWPGDVYYLYRHIRYNPVIKIPYNRTAAICRIRNMTAINLDIVRIYVSYFTLPFST